MLVDEPKALRSDPIMSMIGLMNGNTETKQLQTGVYLITHFGSSHFMKGYEDLWIDGLSIEPHGVCDHFQQVLDRCPELENSPDRGFVITVTPVRKANQEPEGGWRWHKWGPYIGNHTPTTEYLYDEPEIEEVFVYHIYERT